MSRRTAYLLMLVVIIIPVTHLALPALEQQRTSFEVGAHIAEAMLAAIALLALIYARDQVQESQNARHATLLVAKASFMLEMDRRWDSPELTAGFAVYAGLRDKANTPEEFTKAVAAIRDDNIDDYRKLSAVLGFFETVGVMVKRGYIDEIDIDELFGGAIVDAGTWLRPHIDATREKAYKKGMPNGLFDNTLFLIDRMIKLDARRSGGTR